MHSRSMGLGLVLIAGGLVALSGTGRPTAGHAEPSPAAPVSGSVSQGPSGFNNVPQGLGVGWNSPPRRPAPATPVALPESSGVREVRPDLTPGAVWSVDKERICTTPTREVRNVPRSVRAAVIRAYGSPARGTFVIDHLVPLGVGGSNEAANLWPEPADVSRLKDVCENRARAMVCSRGTLTLAEAQRGFSTDWKAFCRSIGVAGVQ